MNISSKPKRLADCMNVSADLVKSDAERVRQADAQKFRENQERMVAETKAIQDRVQEAESKADLESAERGKIVAEQIGMAKRSVEEKAAFRQEAEDLKDIVKSLKAALTPEADLGVGSDEGKETKTQAADSEKFESILAPVGPASFNACPDGPKTDEVAQVPECAATMPESST